MLDLDRVERQGYAAFDNYQDGRWDGIGEALQLIPELCREVERVGAEQPFTVCSECASLYSLWQIERAVGLTRPYGEEARCGVCGQLREVWFDAKSPSAVIAGLVEAVKDERRQLNTIGAALTTVDTFLKKGKV